MEHAVPDDALARGLEYLRRNGTELMGVLAAHSAGIASGDDVLVHLRPYQNDDGGWERFDGDMEGSLSTISQTWLGLQWLLWTRPSDTTPLDRTVEFLRRSQHDDGYWDEPEEILKYDPPPWMIPGDFSNRLWLTSAVCCKLLELGREAAVGLDAAIEYLRKGWDGSRFPGGQHTHWMAVYIFASLSEPTDLDRRIARGCASRLIDELSKGIGDALDVTSIAYVAFRSGTRDLFDVAFPIVVGNQAEDGGWTTGYDDIHRPQCTIEAMHLIKMVSEAARRP